MMNTFTKTLATITLSLSTIGMANAADSLFAADDSVSSKLCVVAAQGSKIQLHKSIKDSGLSKSYIAENVTCNDQNILAFVQDYAEDPDKMNNVLTNGKFNTNVEIIDLAAANTKKQLFGKLKPEHGVFVYIVVAQHII